MSATNMFLGIVGFVVVLAIMFSLNTINSDFIGIDFTTMEEEIIGVWYFALLLVEGFLFFFIFKEALNIKKTGL